jgi:hypothetical protein
MWVCHPSGTPRTLAWTAGGMADAGCRGQAHGECMKRNVGSVTPELGSCPLRIVSLPGRRSGTADGRTRERRHRCDHITAACTPKPRRPHDHQSGEAPTVHRVLTVTGLLDLFGHAPPSRGSRVGPAVYAEAAHRGRPPGRRHHPQSGQRRSAARPGPATPRPIGWSWQRWRQRPLPCLTTLMVVRRAADRGLTHRGQSVRLSKLAWLASTRERCGDRRWHGGSGRGPRAQ